MSVGVGMSVSVSVSSVSVNMSVGGSVRQTLGFVWVQVRMTGE